jgi:hypothetical protein
MYPTFDNPHSPWHRPRREERSWHDTMQVCVNGHQITSMATSNPEYQKKRCPKCGAPTLTTCPKCATTIPGYHHTPGVVDLGVVPVPSFCENCGEPYPWTGKENPAPDDEDAASQPATEHVLPLDVVKGTRKYLEQIVNQANGCYEKGWFDACSVMVRKLIEVLIIAVYEAKGEAEAIKTDGNFLMLSGLIDAILAHGDCNLGRETKSALPLLKSLGDRAAHNRHYMARKTDVDRVLSGLRVAVEDLLHHAGLVH